MSSSKREILDRVREITKNTLSSFRVKVYLFGSWAKGEGTPSSDIDLAVEAEEPLPPGTLALLRERYEESHIPYRVDLVDLAQSDSKFREKVRREGWLWSG